MKRLFYLIPFVLLFCPSPLWSQTCSNTQEGTSGFTCVKNAYSRELIATTGTITYASGYTAGQTIIVAVVANGGVQWAAGAVIDTRLYTFNLVLSCPAVVSGIVVAVYAASVPSTNAASDTITATNPSGNNTVVILSTVYSGVGSVDGTGVCHGSASNTTTPATGNYTVTTGDLNFGFMNANNGSLVPGTNWADREKDNIGGYYMVEAQVAASGTANATWTSANGTYNSVGVAFLPPSTNHPKATVINSQ